MPVDNDAVIAWLQGLGKPRPLVWQSYIYRRRMRYGFLCLLLLVIAVGIPLYYGVQQMSANTTADTTKPNQIALSLGAVIVVAYVLFVHSLFKMYDDVRWLGQRGLIAEANLLAVLRGPKRLIVSYRFWDQTGLEREREALIELDSDHRTPDLRAGMMVPILYDPTRPDTRNFLWAEMANYLTIK